MPTYISLVNWTAEGISGFRDTLDRLGAATSAAERFGGTIKDAYWTLGQYDVVAISEFPDDESATAFSLLLGAQGNVRTNTLRAFDRDEMQGIIDKTG